MAATGACLLLTAWVPLYFSFLFLFEEPPEWHTRSEGCCGELAHVEGRKQLGCVFAAARKSNSALSVTGRRQTHQTEKGNWVFLPFKKLKYRLFGWTPVDRIVAGINMDLIYLLAGNPRGDVPRVIQASMDDLIILFFRWFDEDDLVWPLQREVTKAALFREHYRYARQFLHEVSEEEQEPLAPQSTPVLSVQEYRQLSAAQRRLRNWFFDGNTFVKRDRGRAKNDYLTEDDVDFMRGLPLSVLRIARGVFAPSMPASVARLSEELKIRNITTVNQLLEETNFIDFFALFDIFDEMYTQVDVLREFHRNWINEGIANLPQQSLPPGQWTGAQNLTALLTSPKTSPAEFPKCSTLKCFMRLKWSSTPVRFIQVVKQNVNSLKLLLVGNSGVAKPVVDHEKGWIERVKIFFGFDELQQTVAALKDWHAREKADAVLGLGSILGIPSATSVRSERFETKWYNVFVKEGGLDVPWLMTVGEDEGLLSPATPIRYHYTLQQPNWYMPNDMYTVVFRFQADMTLENGALQRDDFTVTVVNLNTWALLAGNPITNNIQMQLDRMTWISRQLFAAAKRNSTWLIVMGHHPVVSTGVGGKQARLQYLEDIYAGSYYRGWEHLVLHHLFFHYQVDAYVSGHDYLMEYNTMEDLDNNTTISFINSGSTARMMDRNIGRGWIGRLRGALYPVLCFAGRRVLFLADPGGCAPRGYEKSDAIGWFAPKFGNFKINFLQRVIDATGFTSLQLTKDYMVVEFIDGRTKKPATRRLQRRSNKGTRDVTFANPVEVGRQKYEEVQQKREDFVRANLELLRKEIYFAKRCPVLAERITSYIREINSMVDRYERIRREKEAFQKMTEMDIEDAAAVGLDWDMEMERATAEMRAVSKYYHSLKEKYSDLLAVKDTLPPGDDPRYTELLQHEKTMMNLKRTSLGLVRRLGLDAPIEVGEQYALIEKKIAALSTTIGDLEKAIKTVRAPISKGTTGKQKSQQATGDSKELLIARLLETEQKLLQVQGVLRGVQQADIRMSLERASKVKQQLEAKLSNLRAQLSTYLEPLHPSFVWQKQQELNSAETKMRQMTSYLERMQRKTVSAAEAAEDDVRAVEQAQSQLQELQAQVQKLQELLVFRQVTPLQQQFLDKKAALATAQLVEAQRNYLQGEENDVQRVKDSLSLATEAKRHLKSELEQLEQQVNEELQKAVSEWEKQQAFQKEKRQEQGKETGHERTGEGGAHTLRVEMRVPESPTYQGTRENDVAVNASPPSTPAKTETRRLSEVRPVRDSRGLVKPVRGKIFAGFRREQKEESSRNLAKGIFRAPPAALPVGVRRLSVSQSVKSSAEASGTPGGAQAISGELSGESIHTSSRKVSPSVERRSRIQPGSGGKKGREQSEERQRRTGSSRGPSKTSAERGRETVEAADTGRNSHTPGAEQKAESSVKAEGGTPETKRTPQEKKASAAEEGKLPDAKRTPRKKKHQDAQQKGSAGVKALEVEGAAPIEDEYLEEELDKIDVGPLDGCQAIPILDVMVRRALNPEGNADDDTKCENIFADRALNRQLVTLTNNQLLSRGLQGLGASVHPVPSVHISRGWRLYFQDTPKIMFKALMRDLKAGLSFVEKTFRRVTEGAALRQKLQEKSQIAAQASHNTTLHSAEKTSSEGTQNGPKAAVPGSADFQHHRPASQFSKELPTDEKRRYSTAHQPAESTMVLSQGSRPGKTSPGGTEKDSQGEQRTDSTAQQQAESTMVLSQGSRPEKTSPGDTEEDLQDEQRTDSTAQQPAESTMVLSQESRPEMASPGGTEKNSQNDHSSSANQSASALKQPTTDEQLIDSTAEPLESAGQPKSDSGEK